MDVVVGWKYTCLSPTLLIIEKEEVVQAMLLLEVQDK